MGGIEVIRTQQIREFCEITNQLANRSRISEFSESDSLQTE